MAIARDASSNGATSGSTTVTVAHTCSGTDRILIVGITDQDYTQPTSGNVTGVTYNGVAMTSIGNRRVNGNDVWVHLYALLAPATGTNNIVATRSTTESGFYIAASSYTGVDQGIAIGSLVNNTGASSGNASSYTGTLTTPSDNCWTLIVGYSRAGGATAGSGTSLITSNNEMYIWDSNAPITPAGSTTLNVNQTSNWYAYVMVAFAPNTGGGGGGSTGRKLSLLAAGI